MLQSLSVDPWQQQQHTGNDSHESAMQNSAIQPAYLVYQVNKVNWKPYVVDSTHLNELL